MDIIKEFNVIRTMYEKVDINNFIEIRNVISVSYTKDNHNYYNYKENDYDIFIDIPSIKRNIEKELNYIKKDILLTVPKNIIIDKELIIVLKEFNFENISFDINHTILNGKAKEIYILAN